MSTEANVQIAQKAYADFGRGDIPAILAILDESIEWRLPGDLPNSGTYRGPAEVARFFQLVGETWTFTAFNPREFLASGDRLAVIGTYTATARSTGRELSSDWVMLWRFRNGKVTDFQEFTDTLAAHNAVSARAAA